MLPALARPNSKLIQPFSLNFALQVRDKSETHRRRSDHVVLTPGTLDLSSSKVPAIVNPPSESGTRYLSSIISNFSGDLKMSTQQPLTFLTLPAEIRTIVYRLVSEGTKVVITAATKQNDGSQWPFSATLNNIDLLTTCKQVYREAGPVLLPVKTTEIPIAALMHPQLPRTIKASILSVSNSTVVLTTRDGVQRLMFQLDTDNRTSQLNVKMVGMWASCEHESPAAVDSLLRSITDSNISNLDLIKGVCRYVQNSLTSELEGSEAIKDIQASVDLDPTPLVPLKFWCLLQELHPRFAPILHLPLHIKQIDLGDDQVLVVR